jgi:DNA topoisomerase IB
MLILAELKDRANFNALLKILTILAIKLQGGKIKPLKESIGDANKAAALEFLKKYGADGKLFAALYLNILKKSDAVQPHAEPFIANLRKVINSSRIKHDLEAMSSDSKQVLDPVLTLLGNPDSANALSLLNRRIGLLKEPDLTKKFSDIYTENARDLELGDDRKDSVPTDTTVKPKKTAPTPGNTVDRVAEQINQVIYEITKDKGATGVSAAQKAAAQATPRGKELLSQLAKLRKQLTDYKLSEIRNVVAQAPDNIMSSSDLTRALVKRGIKKLSIPPAFQTSDVVHVNLDGQWCDADGRVAIRQGWQSEAEIVVNPSYSHDTPKKNWLYKIITTNAEGKKTINYIQTQAKVAQKRAANFTKVDDTLAQDIKSVKSKWRNAMKGKPDDEKTVYANLAEFVYQTTSRIGSGEGMTKGTNTYGASNFLVKHVNLAKATDTRLMIKYHIAKSSKEETFILSAKSSDVGSPEDARWMKTLIAFIVKKCEGKKPEDVVFTIGKGQRVNSSSFNGYLKAIGLPFTAKTFRTMRGTELAIEALEQAEAEFNRLKGESKKPLPQATVTALFKAAMENVGELLGHIRRNKAGDEESTSNTAIKSYINPKVMIDWFQRVGYAPPSNVIQSAKDAGLDV